MPSGSSFHADKSTDSYLTGVDALRERARHLGHTVRALKGDFDTAWAVQGRPEFILTRKVQDYCTKHGIDFTPV